MLGVHRKRFKHNVQQYMRGEMHLNVRLGMEHLSYFKQGVTIRTSTVYSEYTIN